VSAVAALKEPEQEAPPPNIRRFSMGDLSTHGAWLLKRLLNAYPQLNEKYVAGWLRGMLDSNEYLFICTESAVALFQTLSVHSLENKPWIWERFVFCKEGYVMDGAECYKRCHEWAKSMGVEQIIVEQLSDVPHEVIKEALGRLYTRQQIFARV
jgi:hypothetical protein